MIERVRSGVIAVGLNAAPRRIACRAHSHVLLLVDRCVQITPLIPISCLPPSLRSDMSSSTRQQSETDETLRAQLAALPTTTPNEQAYAALAAQLLDSAAFWRAKVNATHNSITARN